MQYGDIESNEGLSRPHRYDLLTKDSLVAFDFHLDNFWVMRNSHPIRKLGLAYIANWGGEINWEE